MLRPYSESHAPVPAAELFEALAQELHVPVTLLRERLEACAPGVLLQTAFAVGKCAQPQHIVLIGDAGCTAFVRRHGDGLRVLFGRLGGRVCDGLQAPLADINGDAVTQVDISLAERAQK